MVLRCRRTGSGSAAGASVIVKAYPSSAAGREAFAREAAGLTFAGPAGVGPALLGLDRDFPLLVIEDLGAQPSLADLLLGTPSPRAGAALSDWTASCGRLARWSTGRAGEFTRLRAGYGEPAPGAELAELPAAISAAPTLLALAGVPVPDGLAGEVAALGEFAAGEQYQVFSPGDLCPDNNLVTAAGVRLIDFESAGFHPVFLDAAYLRMPFSTCWCVLRLPDQLGAALEQEYRALVCPAFPALADDQVWHRGVRWAAAAWTLHAMSYLLDRCVKADQSMNKDVAGAPSARALLRYRWQSLLAELSAGAELPALAAAMAGLLAATEHWQAPRLPVYPALC